MENICFSFLCWFCVFFSVCLCVEWIQYGRIGSALQLQLPTAIIINKTEQNKKKGNMKDMDGKWVDSRSRWVDKWYGMDNSRVMSRKGRVVLG